MHLANCQYLIWLVGACCTPCMAAEAALQEPIVPALRWVDGRAWASAKARLHQGDKDLQPALKRLCENADAALNQRPVSVMDKRAMPPSGNRHDYVSMGPYWWPNPDTADGLPYIRRDGHVNPEREQFDYVPLRTLTDSVHVLSLAYYLTDKQVYAAHAARMIRTWFLDEATRMNPNLTFGQHIPGITKGRGIGLIETRRFVDILEDVSLLAGSDAWQAADARALKQWFSDFLTWMLESKNGQDEAATKNNHGSWYDVQAAYYALFTGRDQVAQEVLSRFAQKHLARHIEPDGSQMPLLYSVLRAPSPTPRDLKTCIGSAKKQGGFAMDGYIIWCASVIKVDDMYHMFASRWPAEYGLGGWTKYSECVRATSKDLLGPYTCISTDPVFTKTVTFDDGTTETFRRRERPFIYTNDKGEAIVLFTACLPFEGLIRVVAQPVDHYYPGNPH